MDGWMDGWMDRWMDGWMDGWMDKRMILTLCHSPIHSLAAKERFSKVCLEGDGKHLH